MFIILPILILSITYIYFIITNNIKQIIKPIVLIPIVFFKKKENILKKKLTI